MPPKHLFVIDPIDKLNLKLDTSLKIACELTKLGQEVYICHIEDLEWSSRATNPAACACQIIFSKKTLLPKVLQKSRRTLTEFYSIHMRKEPPVDFRYLHATLILDQVAEKTKVYNAPKALRSYNEKLLPFLFPQHSITAFVSTKVSDLTIFLQEKCRGDAVIKPLNLFGGKQVLRLNTKTTSIPAISKQLETETQGQTTPLLIQPFLKEIFSGEARVFTLKGKPLAWCLKKPKPGSFLANTHSGAAIKPFEPGKQLSKTITQIAGDLYAKGITFAGFDLIQEKISEINITSPRLLAPQEDDSTYFQKIVASLI